MFRPYKNNWRGSIQGDDLGCNAGNDFAFVRMPKDEREGWGTDAEGDSYEDEPGASGHTTGAQRQELVGSHA